MGVGGGPAVAPVVVVRQFPLGRRGVGETVGYGGLGASTRLRRHGLRLDASVRWTRGRGGGRGSGFGPGGSGCAERVISAGGRVCWRGGRDYFSAGRRRTAYAIRRWLGREPFSCPRRPCRGGWPRFPRMGERGEKPSLGGRKGGVAAGSALDAQANNFLGSPGSRRGGQRLEVWRGPETIYVKAGASVSNIW
jgi:hypothetical protein